MARRRLDIDINTNSDDRGASKAISALDKVKNAARKIGKDIQGDFTSISHGVARIKDGFESVTHSVARVVRRVVGIGAAATATAAVAVRAFMNSDDALQNLIDTSKSYGDKIDDVIPKYKNLSKAIQDNTRIGDDEVLSLIEQLRNLGVLPDKMEEAVKGTIGLSRALRMDMGTAARVTALALQGNVEMLSRYSPEMRTATTDAEKMATAQNLMAKGYKQAEDQAGTLTGRYEQFKNKLGNLFEELGQGISDALDLKGTFEGMTKAIDTFINSGAIAAWAEKFKKIREDAEAIFTAITKGGKGQEALGALKNILIGAFEIAANTAARVLAKVAPIIGHALGKAAKEAITGVEQAVGNDAATLNRMRQEGIISEDQERFPFFLPREIQAERSRRNEELVRAQLTERGEMGASSLPLSNPHLEAGFGTLEKLVDQGKTIQKEEGAKAERRAADREASRKVLDAGDVAAQGATADPGRGAVINYLADRLGDAQAGSAEAKMLNAQLQAVLGGNLEMTAQLMEIMKLYYSEMQQIKAQMRNMRL